MKLGFNISINSGINNSSSIEALIFGMIAGQSLADDLFDDDGGDGSKEGYDALLAELPAGSDVIDAAVGGTSILEWVDNSSYPILVNGTYLNSYYTICDSATGNDRTKINVVYWRQFQSDRNLVTVDGLGVGEITPAQHKEIFEFIVAGWKSEHGSDVKIVIGLPHRRTSATDQENWASQKMRENYIAVGEADPNIEFTMIDDLDLFDTTHLTVAGKTEQGTRVGKMMSYLINGTSKPDYSNLQSSVISGLTVTLTFSSNVTLPSAGTGQVHVREEYYDSVAGETLYWDVPITSMDHGVSNNIVILTMTDELIESNDAYVYISWGLNSNLAATGADCLMNGDGSLPARGAVKSVTGVYPAYTGAIISAITDVDSFWDATKNTKTYATGLEVTAVAGEVGGGIDNHPNVIHGNTVFDEDLFATGVGGILDTAGDACMQMVDGFTADGGMTILEANFFPATLADDPPTMTGVRLFTFGLDEGASDADASFFLNTTGVKWGRDQSSAYPVLHLGAHPYRHINSLRFNSLTSVESLMDETSYSVDIDPRDDYAVYPHFHIFSRGGQTDGVLGRGIGARVVSNAVMADADVATIAKHWARRFKVAV